MESGIKGLADSTALVCRDEILEMLSSEDWTDKGINKGVKCFQRFQGDHKKVLLGVCLMEFPVEVIARYLVDVRNKESWEPLLLSTHVLFDYGDCKVIQEVFRAPWPVSQRDFVFVAKREVVGEDVLLVGKSVDVGVPEGRGVVRAEVIMSGFYLRKLKNEQTEVKYLVCIDPKGNIPMVLANFASAQQLLCLNRIRTGISAQLALNQT